MNLDVNINVLLILVKNSEFYSPKRQYSMHTFVKMLSIHVLESLNTLMSFVVACKIYSSPIINIFWSYIRFLGHFVGFHLHRYLYPYLFRWLNRQRSLLYGNYCFEDLTPNQLPIYQQRIHNQHEGLLQLRFSNYPSVSKIFGYIITFLNPIH